MLAVSNFFFAVKWIYFLSGSLAPFEFYHAEKVIEGDQNRDILHDIISYGMYF